MLLIRPLLLALLLSIGLPLHAQSSAAAQLAALLDKAQTLRGNFSQVTLSASGTQLQQAKGRMALQRPRMFRWQTDAPLEQLLVSNGQTVWLYDPDLQQVTVQKLDERLTHTPALLLSGDVSQISQHFDISEEDDGDLQRFTLKPKGESSLFDSLHLSFKHGVIHDMQLIDGSGQRTRLSFSEVQMNRVLVDTPFTFDIPPGTDVIEE